MEHESPALTVVLPIRNEAEHIETILSDLLDQTLPASRYEIVVADGRSTDDSRDRVLAMSRTHPSIRLVDNPGRLSSRGRNAGTRAARGRYVFFVDGHCRAENPRLLEDVLAAFESGARCLSRPQPLAASNACAKARAIVEARMSRLGHHPGSMIYSRERAWVDPRSAGCGYTRELLEQLGGFDPFFDAAEDVEFNGRVHALGIKALHAPEFAITYVARGHWRSLFAQMVRYGRGRARLIQRRRSEFTLGTVAPLGLVSALVATPIAGSFPGLRALAIGATVGVASIATAVVVCDLARRARVSTALMKPVALATIHIGAAMGFAFGFVFDSLQTSTSHRRSDRA